MPRAGLDAATVTAAGAAVADEIGLGRLSMSVVAERLGVRSPSLYKHVDSIAALVHRVATLAVTELGDALREATQGIAGRDALLAAALALRAYAKAHPGRYAATTEVHPVGPEDPLARALERTLASFGAVLHGYDLGELERVSALRTVRSALHGFVALESSDAFQLDSDLDGSFLWLVDFLDRGMRG